MTPVWTPLTRSACHTGASKDAAAALFLSHDPCPSRFGVHDTRPSSAADTSDGASSFPPVDTAGLAPSRTSTRVAFEGDGGPPVALLLREKAWLRCDLNSLQESSEGKNSPDSPSPLLPAAEIICSTVSGGQPHALLSLATSRRRLH